jgi:hypothetical protein
MSPLRLATRPLALAWLALGLAGAAAVLHATALGIGVSPDSTVYLGVARRGVERFHLAPISFPAVGGLSSEIMPAYPALLAAASVTLQQDPQHAARWLHAILLPLNLLLAGLLLRRALPGARALPWLGGLGLLVSPGMLTVHTMAWTEGPFLSLVMLGVWALDAYFADPRRIRLLTIVGLVAAACLTRSAGVAFAGAAIVALFLWGPGTTARRVLRAAAAGAAMVAPMAAWVIFTPGYRRLALHPPTGEWLLTAWSTMANWIVPDVLPLSNAVRTGIALAVFGAGLGMLLWREFRRARATPSAPGSRIAAILLLYSMTHPIMIVVVRTLWDANTVVDRRGLVPLNLSVVLLLFVAAAQVRGRRERPESRRTWVAGAAVAAGMAAWMTASAVAARDWLAYAHHEGQGYEGRLWQEAGIMRAVAALPRGTFLVSNGNDAIMAVTGRRAMRIPDEVIPSSRQPNPDYASRMQDLRRRLQESDGRVVLFYVLRRQRWYLPDEADLMREWDLEPVVVERDGAIYRVWPEATAP